MRKIAIDAGHGMYTPGKRCDARIDPFQTREWVLNSRIISLVEQKLQAYDVEVLRTDDPTGRIDVPVGERRDKADAFGAEIFISVHHNAGIHCGPGGGTVAFTDSTPNKVKDSSGYAKLLYDYVTNRTCLIGNRSKKVSDRSLAVGRTKCPSVLLENGFMDSTTDTPIILTEEHAQRTASGIIDFLVNACFVQKKGIAPGPAVIEKECCYIGRTTAADGLNLRYKPSSAKDSEVLAILPKNSYILIVRERSDGWVLCNTPDGKTGYIYKKYTYPLHEVDFPRRQVTDHTGLNIRTGAGTANPMTATIPYKATFMVCDDPGAWGVVWCGDSIGWASLSDKYSKPI